MAGWVNIEGAVTVATLDVVAEFASVELLLNGQPVGEVPAFHPRSQFDVTRHLGAKGGLLVLSGTGVPGPSAVALRLEVMFKDGSRKVIVSDHSWRGERPDSDASALIGKLPPAATFGPLDAYPWGPDVGDITITPLDNYEQWRLAQNAGEGTAASAFRTRPGFTIERLRSAAKDEDSWISLTFDPQGRVLIAKEKQGLLRMTLAEDRNSVARVEAIHDTLAEVRGLAFLEGALYANGNEHNQKPRVNEGGLYRLRDTNGDDRFDEVTLVGPKTRTGGHGRNDLTVGPDGMIYLMHGDSVSVPETARVLPPPVKNLNPGDDRTHGHLIRTDREGRHWEVVAHGLRNPFGIAFNEDGEAFTYDADAEFDMGSAWYRPTHVRHLVSGADFGWRNVTGTWPPYFLELADDAPDTLVIGKGSPTAVEFGTRSHFPPAHRRALYILDWAYGRIIAVHFVPQGASYVGRAETFLRGTPANVTDLAFGPDGAMYFVTGGRGTQSALYRVRYTGPKIEEAPATAQQQARETWSRQARALRRELESFHGRQDPMAIEAAWPHLDNVDPWIRHAARVAIEHQPADRWQDRALAETNTVRLLHALLALARIQPAGVHSRVLERLGGVALDQLSADQKLVALRTVEICLRRIETPEPALAARVLDKLDALYPDMSPAVNHELGKLLAALGVPGAVPRTLALLEAAASQEERMHYLFALRHVRDEALAGVTPAGRQAFDALLVSYRRETEPEEAPAAPRPFVKRWTMADAAALQADGQPRDYERGKSMFAAAMCGRCHTLGAEGRPFGPDLTNVSSRFNRRDLLEAILEPSKFVAENFRNVIVTTKDGDAHSGQVVLEGDYRLATLRLVTDPLQPFKVTEIPKPDIVTHRESEVSPMPEGLLDSLTREEILDLLAYVEAGGNAAHPVFGRQVGRNLAEP
jgi:putative heme-binding domain-containing protein